MIIPFSINQNFDHLELYRTFLESETNSTGTVVLHHGRVKQPGKKVPNFSTVELAPLVDDVDAQLAGVAFQAKEKFDLNQVLVVHRIGSVCAGDSVLLVIVSGKTRDRCFTACSWIVDEIKREEFIELTEHL